MVIGITGGSGTGKSFIARAMGCEVIDVDQLYHAMLKTDENLRGELVAAFGTCARKEMAEIVFSDDVKLNKLNAIASKYMISVVKDELRRMNGQDAADISIGGVVTDTLIDAVKEIATDVTRGDIIIDAAMLFELGLDAKCDVTVAVLARQDIRITRIMERDGLSSTQAQARISAQKSDEFYAKSADIIIHTNGDTADLVQRFKNKLASKTAQKNIITNNVIDPPMQKTAINGSTFDPPMQKTAIYGGTFDPPTLGHLDVIKCAAATYRKLYVVALVNEAKTPVFTPQERVEMLKAITNDIPNVTVDSYIGLLTEYAHLKNARYSVRGVRNGFDADYERPMFEFNAQIAREEFGFELDTIFIPTTRDHSDTSSGNVCRLLAGGAYKVGAKYLDGRIVKQVIARF